MPWPCLHPDCDDVYDDRHDAGVHYFNKHGESYIDALVVSQYDQLPEEFYREQYHDEGNTLGEIGQLIGVGASTIYRRMDAHDIPRERGSEASTTDEATPGIVAQKRAEVGAERDQTDA